jgi:hypothetical protein
MDMAQHPKGLLPRVVLHYSRMHKQRVAAILESEMKVGEQGTIEEIIPLPQFQIEEHPGYVLYLIIYSSLHDPQYHDGLVQRLCALLNAHEITCHERSTGVSYCVERPVSKFLATRLKLVCITS